MAESFISPYTARSSAPYLAKHIHQTHVGMVFEQWISKSTTMKKFIEMVMRVYGIEDTSVKGRKWEQQADRMMPEQTLLYRFEERTSDFQ